MGSAYNSWARAGQVVQRVAPARLERVHHPRADPEVQVLRDHPAVLLVADHQHGTVQGQRGLPPVEHRAQGAGVARLGPDVADGEGQRE
jgi:hypothetical protein